MRMRIEEFNIYRWAADFLTSLSQAKGRPEETPAPPPSTHPSAQ
jgi:hypothetical protein